jgi:hypothetical protein
MFPERRMGSRCDIDLQICGSAPVRCTGLRLFTSDHKPRISFYLGIVDLRQGYEYRPKASIGIQLWRARHTWVLVPRTTGTTN